MLLSNQVLTTYIEFIDNKIYPQITSNEFDSLILTTVIRYVDLIYV